MPLLLEAVLFFYGRISAKTLLQGAVAQKRPSLRLISGVIIDQNGRPAITLRDIRAVNL